MALKEMIDEWLAEGEFAQAEAEWRAVLATQTLTHEKIREAFCELLLPIAVGQSMKLHRYVTAQELSAHLIELCRQEKIECIESILSYHEMKGKQDIVVLTHALRVLRNKIWQKGGEDPGEVE